MLSFKSAIIVFSLKDMAKTHTGFYANKSDICHTRLKQQLMQYNQITLVSPSKNADEKNVFVCCTSPLSKQQFSNWLVTSRWSLDQNVNGL